ncbi:Spo0E family sporulation regulatory protein-aspartic acid phosphatase [Bacillus salitolerans]|uniref:Spo0E family sporulation regulatory protein-aspartic acid phosphatase n=1 Tax=Bacillus salitolerans TaxID=1437434 RepID=A0ABW4LV32_9BACI
MKKYASQLPNITPKIEGECSLDYCKERSLEVVNRDIFILRNLMYKASERVGRMDDPLVVEISQFLDQKLNQQGELIKSHS